jgi:hypothetical protein
MRIITFLFFGRLTVSQVDSLGKLTKALDARRTSARKRGWPKPWNMMVARIPSCISIPDKPPPLNQKQPDAVHLNDFNLDFPPYNASAKCFPEQRDCFICLDEEAYIAVVGCGHLVLCYSCAVVLRAGENKCPLCARATLDSSGKVQLLVIR